MTMRYINLYYITLHYVTLHIDDNKFGPPGQGHGLSSRATTLDYSEEWLTC